MHLFIQIFSHSTDPYFLSFLKSIHPSINLSLCFFSSIYFSTHVLSIHFSTYLSIYPSIHFSTHLSIYPFLYPSIHLFISQSIYKSNPFSTHLSIYLSIHFSTHLSIYSFLNPSFNPSIRLFISQPIYPSICIQYFGRVFFSSIDADPLYTIRLAFLLILFQDTREKGGREKREKR